MSVNTITLSVPGMSCGHCEAAVKSEVGKLAAVESVSVDLDSKDVVVAGIDLDIDALVAAVDEAGYEATVRSWSFRAASAPETATIAAQIGA